MRALGAGAETTLLWVAIISEAEGILYANLRAPIVINPQRMIGRQVLPDDGLYPIRHPLTTKA
jgi:flagellar assembly factor FliW